MIAEPRWLGRIDYDSAVAEMESRRAAILDGDRSKQAILLAEHDPIITIGRSSKREHILASAQDLARAGIAVREVSRGGDVSYHGPGQLMVYPVVDIGRGLVAFLEAVAAGLIELADALGVHGAEWRRNPAGVWVDDHKLAACGVHIRRRVTNHGFAFNVCTPPEAWRWIVPCGLTTGVTSVARVAGEPVPTVAAVADLAAPILRRALAS